MCILFLYTDDSPGPGYSLILANNRDEFFKRPTAPADFWGENLQFISGRDKEPGREGGTWLGMSKSGKLGSLLNILTSGGPTPNKKGRGHLVTNYLQTEAKNDSYAQGLYQDRKSYDAFHLLLVEHRNGIWEKVYFGNAEEEEAPQTLNGKFLSLSNSVLSKPFEKVKYGEEKFINIVKNCNSKEQRDELVAALIELLNDQSSHVPDKQMEIQGGPNLSGKLYEQRSGVCVWAPQVAYGSRTNTVILVNKDGNCEYIERTLAEPIDGFNPKWDTRTINFSINNFSVLEKEPKKEVKL